MTAMKISTTLTSALFATSSILSFAGEPLPLDQSPLTSDIPAITGTPNFLEKIKFSGDIRARYEFRETDPLDESNALTVRARIGVTLGDFNGFSAFAEWEGTGAPGDDFRSNPAGSPSTSPNVIGNSVISDPENSELNRLYVQYAKEGFLVKVGRQRIIRNNAAFIGNVGWRQNEQTFDAAQIGYKKDAFSVSYVYSDRVQRIFGEDAAGALNEFEGDFHLIDFSYKSDIGDLGGYAYLIDVENNANVGESNTYGVFGTFNGLYAEFAYQDGDSARAGGDYDAIYAHLKYTKKVSGVTLMGGVEYLQDEFNTPFATVHAFNGYADAFVLQRIGLNNGPGGNYDGLTDFYLGLVKPNLPGGITLKGFLHYYLDSDFDNTYGYEADLVLAKKFNANLSGLIKAAYFVGEDFYDDIKQVSFQLDYKF